MFTLIILKANLSMVIFAFNLIVCNIYIPMLKDKNDVIQLVRHVLYASRDYPHSTKNLKTNNKTDKMSFV